jgi:hypothetical protein|tara:strand:+ start:4293 stop:4547 length:255 start_codon:yes stop_codon:yes gene_type:complete
MSGKKMNARLKDPEGNRLTGVAIGEILKVPSRTVQEWLSGGAKFPIDKLVELQRHLDAGDRLFRRWCDEVVRVCGAAKGANREG